ncbi:MAG: hypothetical protein AAGL99_15420, partial [Pseudomonadota bacterium]
LFNKPAILGSCGGGDERAHPVNMIYLLRALAALKALSVLAKRRRASAAIPAIQYLSGDATRRR